MEYFQLEKIIDELKYLTAFFSEARDPIDFPIQLSSTMPWNVDYRNRKHLFIYSPVQLILSLEDYGTSTLFANTWHTLDFPPGMRIFATNQTNPVYAFIKATDEPTLLDYNTVITATISGTPTVNITALNGTAPSSTNPFITNTRIEQLIQSGNGFTSSTGNNTTAGAIQVAHSIFNPNGSGKTLYVYSISSAMASSSMNLLNASTSDPAYASAAAPVNLSLGNATASVANGTFSNTAASTVGTNLKAYQLGGLEYDVMPLQGIIAVPPNHGLINFVTTSTNAWHSTIQWVEV